MYWVRPEVFSAIHRWGRKRYEAWIEGRLPLQESVTLDHSRIVIVPTRQGLMLLIIAISVLLLAINFESALNYALTFWLIAMLWVAVYMTYGNLSGLKISALGGTLVQTGDIAEVRLRLSSAKETNRGTLEAIHSEWGAIQVNMTGSEAVITLPLMAYNRGPIRPPRFRLESRFPFGLVVAWSHLLIDSKAWAYPEPIQTPRRGDTGDSEDDKQHIDDHFIKQGSEDFHSIKPYQPGDSIRRLHWPGFSRDQIMVKTFSDYQASDEWIEWSQFDVADELKLSAIAYYSQEYFQDSKPFGVRMPDVELPPEKGVEHLQRVRRALAEYGHGQ
ncbi:MAG: DUF58 domain-containing protein [Reinekea sp.]